MRFTLKACCGCHMGNIRKNNEDNFFFDGNCLDSDNAGLKDTITCNTDVEKGLCVAVFDGMGGENFGEMASFSAAKALQLSLQKTPDFNIPQHQYLNQLTLELNDAVVAAKNQLYTNRMGTTMVALYFTQDFAYVCNVGDSRAYRLRGDAFWQISEDHIQKREDSSRRKAPLTQHLGIDPMDMQIVPYIAKSELQDADRYLLCSDGLTDMLTNAEIADIMHHFPDPESCVRHLMQAALDRGGRDNITVIVCNITKQDENPNDMCNMPYCTLDSACSSPKNQITKTANETSQKPATEKSGKKSPFLYIVLGFIAAAILFVLLQVINSCNNTPSNTPADTTSTETTTAPIETTAPSELSTDPVQLDWSDWVNQLPANVTAEKYDIEERTLYSSRNLETAASSSKTKEGWELYSTVENGSWSEWSSWSQTAVKESPSRQVETETRYRSRTKETTTSTDASLSDWTQYAYDWGEWSIWSTEVVAESENRSIETKLQYRYRSVSPSDNSFGEWSEWSDTPCNATEECQVETRDFYRYRDKVYHFYRWNDWTDWDTTEVAASEDCQVETTTFYRYCDKLSSSIYYFRRWTPWTEFMEGEIIASDTVEVKTQTQYRYKTKP